MESFCGFIPCLHTKHSHLFVSHCTLQTAHYKLHTTNWTMQTGHLKLNNLLYTHQIAQCTLHTAQCTVYSVECTVHSVQCTVHSAQCTFDTVECTLNSPVTCCLMLQHTKTVKQQGNNKWLSVRLDTDIKHRPYKSKLFCAVRIL